MLTMLDLFSGIGGFSLAAAWTGGIETVAFCEIEPYCQKVLKKHWPDVPIYSDIKELSGYDLVQRYGAIDIVCGGFPCQPFSVAGKQLGKEDDRYLWPEMFRIIQETKPTWVVGENVAHFINMELEAALSNLESEGHEIQTIVLPACAVEAPHERARTWILSNSRCALRSRDIHRGTNEKENGTGYAHKIERPSSLSLDVLAYSCSAGLQGSEQPGTPKQRKGAYGSIAKPSRGDRWTGWQPEPTVARVAHGIPHRVDRIKGLGNAIVPQIAYQILQGIVDIERGAIL